MCKKLLLICCVRDKVTVYCNCLQWTFRQSASLHFDLKKLMNKKNLDNFFLVLKVTGVENFRNIYKLNLILGLYLLEFTYLWINPSFIHIVFQYKMSGKKCKNYNLRCFYMCINWICLSWIFFLMNNIWCH